MINKFNDFLTEMKTKKFKNMTNWSPKAEQKVSKSRKDISSSDGEKFIDLFNKYNLQVDFGAGELLKVYKFGDEEKLKEIRIGLYSYLSYDDWLEYNGYTRKYTDEVLSDKEYRKEYEKYKKFDRKELTSFSVFLGSNHSNNLEYCMGDAYYYLKEKLKNINIFSLIEDNGFSNIDEIKTYMNNIHFNINNENIDKISYIATRLRKDSKVFMYIKEHCETSHTDYTYQNFIDDLKKL